MDAARESAIARARAAGVRGFLLAGVDPAGWRVEDELAQAYPDMAVSYGVHPQVAAAAGAEEVAAMLAELARVLAGRARPAALGELGLDALTEELRAALPRQEHAFRVQLGLARQHRLPLVLHVLRAHQRALSILEEEGAPASGGVVHSYSGGAELAPRYLGLGLHLSFAGPVTYERARRVAAAVRAVPRERLLIETDAPDQTPAPYRPGPNEPAFLPAIAAAVATIRGEPIDDVARYTEENARRLFGRSFK